MPASAREHLWDLRTRWHRLVPGAPEVGEALLARYGDPARSYHDLHHLSAVLEAFDLLSGQLSNPVPVELAAWFHDSVYDTMAADHEAADNAAPDNAPTDNEAASADLAGRLLAPYVDTGIVEEVRRLVLLTRDHAVAVDDRNGGVLCDADLAILAADPAAYDDYVARVRREYIAVPEDAFRAGRASVLRGLLALPRLFHTGHGRTHWEAPARSNLERELATYT